MPRVNIEERAFGDSRLARLERQMDWDRRTALGCLVLLWHDSQALMQIEGSGREIANWCWAVSEDEGERLLRTLEDVGFLTALDTDRYLIRGNEPQIENLMQRASAALKGGAANRARWDGIKASRQSAAPTARGDDPAELPRADSRLAILPASLQPSESHPNASSMQCNAVQGKASISEPPNLLPPTDSSTSFDRRMAERWYAEHAAILMPRLKPNFDSWSNSIRLLRTQDGLTEADIEAVLAFVKSDSFWSKNAISPESVRTKSKNGLRKIENILLSMRTHRSANRNAEYPSLTPEQLRDELR